MKKIVIANYYILLIALLTSCKSNYDVSSLPELPQNLSNLLDTSKNFNGLVTFKNVNTITSLKPVYSKNNSKFAPVDCEEENTYWVQVTYPITWCTEDRLQLPIEVSNGFANNNLNEYKLSNYKNAAIKKTLNCRVHGGPWIMEIKEKRPCGGNVNVKIYDAYLLASAPVSLSWIGTLDDMPQIDNLKLVGVPWRKTSLLTTCGDASCNGNLPTNNNGAGVPQIVK